MGLPNPDPGHCQAPASDTDPHTVPVHLDDALTTDDA